MVYTENDENFSSKIAQITQILFELQSAQSLIFSQQERSHQ